MARTLGVWGTPWVPQLFLLATPAAALDCRDVAFEGVPYAVCELDPVAEPLSLFLRDEGGEPFGDFEAVEAERGALAFAMNAGMYHADRAPVGLYVEEGVEGASLVEGPGPGNFGMVPNGVFCVTERGAFVLETGDYLEALPECRLATQSGPLLLDDGEMHPRFLSDSDSRYVRNGVGTSLDGQRAAFAISGRPVTFHEFARFFRDGLDLPDALYFDGNVSRLHAPDLGRSDGGRRMGPIVGLLEADRE